MLKDGSSSEFKPQVKNVRKKYHRHIWWANRPRPIWHLRENLIMVWEKNALKSQRPVPLKPLHFAFLEMMTPNEIEDHLNRVLNHKILYNDIKYVLLLTRTNSYLKNIHVCMFVLKYNQFFCLFVSHTVKN